MNNTQILYTKAKEYQDKRKAVIDAYEDRLAYLEQMRGSKYYEDEAKKAETIRDDALTALKAEYIPGFEAIFKEMQAVSGRREIKAPTAEELRIVQALKLRDYKSMENKNLDAMEEELSRIARTVKGNSMCLSIVQDVARENGINTDYMEMYTGSNMPHETVIRCLAEMRKKIIDFVEYDTSPVGRFAREKHEQRFGKMDEGTMPEEVLLGVKAGYSPIPKRELFNTQTEFYSSIFGLNNEPYSMFSAAVND